MTSPWRDSPHRYGLISRMLHWAVAALLAWQYMGMAVKIIVGRGSAVVGFLVSTHKPVGTLLMLLIATRAAWGLSQWRRRPSHPGNAVGRLAAAGHAVLYALMLYVPAVALLREYGRGRGFAPFGIPLFPETGQEVVWMLPLANASHALLAWTLLALIAGHVAMVALHHWWWRDGTLARMTGRLSARPDTDTGPDAR